MQQYSPSEITPDIISVHVKSALSRGFLIDSPISRNGNTLLHYAVFFQLQEDVNHLLALGANTGLRNNLGISPKDVALEVGDQVIILMLNRRDKYKKHLYYKRTSKKERNTAREERIYSNTSNASSVEPYQSSNRDSECRLYEWKYNSKDVFEDYLDWCDKRRAFQLQQLLDSLTSEEEKYQNKIEDFRDLKKNTLNTFSKLFAELREREHYFCLKIWKTIEIERNNRADLQKLSDEISSQKQKINEYKTNCIWKGYADIKLKNPFMFSSWKKLVEVYLSGESLVVFGPEGKDILLKLPVQNVTNIRIEGYTESSKSRKEMMIQFKSMDSKSSSSSSSSSSSTIMSSTSQSNYFISKSIYSTPFTSINQQGIYFSFPETPQNSTVHWLQRYFVFLDSIKGVNEEIDIILVNKTMEINYRPSLADSSCLTSLESFTISSLSNSGSLANTKESDHTRSSHSSGNIKDVENNPPLSPPPPPPEESDQALPNNIPNQHEQAMNTPPRTPPRTPIKNNNSLGKNIEEPDEIVMTRSNSDSMNGSDYLSTPTRSPQTKPKQSMQNHNKNYQNFINDHPYFTNINESNNLDRNSMICSTDLKPQRIRDVYDQDRRSVSALYSSPRTFSSSNLKSLNKTSPDIISRKLDFSVSAETPVLKSIIQTESSIQKMRQDRDEVQKMLVNSITKRERYLEIVHYLQSLKSLLSNPPDMPSRNLSSVSLPSIEIALANFSKFKEKMNSSISFKSSNEEFSVSDFETSSQVEGGAGAAAAMSDLEIDDSQSFIAAMLDQTLVEDSEDSICSPIHEMQLEDSILNLSIPISNSQRKPSHRVLGPPPLELYAEFGKVVHLLEELWRADRGSFETVENLANILILREQTWRRLSSIRQNDKSTFLDESELFEVIF